MTTETILRNAQLVLPETVMEADLVIRDGMIADFGAPTGGSTGEDMEGDYVMAGLIELHTDHLEQHYSPRPGVTWNLTAAIQAHDAQVTASGITTVFDCLRLGSDEHAGFAKGEMRAMSDAIRQAQDEHRLRADHRIHLRCEVSAPDVLDHFEEFEDDPAVGLMSLMDHAPGQRQFQTMDQYELYYKTKRGLSDTEFADFVAARKAQSAKNSAPNREALAKAAHDREIALASHDDATEDHVAEAIRFGTKVAEFPTSMVAAKASHDAGMGVLMGAPNVVRGKSHSGNIAARDLAQDGVLDVLSSDYVPFSLIYAPFILADQFEHIGLADAMRLVTDNPARQVGLHDRGRIETGRRADLIRVRREPGHVPVLRTVWREGRRVA